MSTENPFDLNGDGEINEADKDIVYYGGNGYKGMAYRIFDATTDGLVFDFDKSGTFDINDISLLNERINHSMDVETTIPEIEFDNRCFTKLLSTKPSKLEPIGGADTYEVTFGTDTMRLGLSNYTDLAIEFDVPSFEELMTQVSTQCEASLDSRSDAKYPLIINFKSETELSGGQAYHPDFAERDGDYIISLDRAVVNTQYLYTDIIPSVLRMRDTEYPYEEGRYTDAVHDWLINRGFSESDLMTGEIDDLFDILLSAIVLEESMELPILNSNMSDLEASLGRDIVSINDLFQGINAYVDANYGGVSGLSLPGLPSPDSIDNYSDHLSLPTTSEYVRKMISGDANPIASHTFDGNTMINLMSESFPDIQSGQIETLNLYLNQENTAVANGQRVDYFDN